ncbi:MAG: ABC transporter ATP-binding protein [Synergistales bacterium]|nr:ABC transporter ATP-binding protein [Synergistales bacterium]
MTLSVENLGFRWGHKWVFRGLSFSVEKGQLMSVMGPNGVGKTTLLRCLNGILSPSEGSVTVGGRDISSMSRRQVARAVGYVPQFVPPQRMTVFDGVLLGRRPHIGWSVSDRDLNYVESVLSLLGLSDFRLRSMDEISGGERQKVAIARAMVQEPSVMLLDEPTASLDIKNNLDMMETIAHVVHCHGLAAVATIHDINCALRHSDRCLFLKGGSIKTICSPSEVDEATIESVYDIKSDIINHRGMPVVIPGG